MSTNIGFHTRLRSDPTQKVIGGSFGGDIDWTTVERFVKARQYDVRILPSGSATFVDRQGRDVCLYFTIDADRTERGKEVRRIWRMDQRRLEEQRELDEQRRKDELDQAMEGLSHEEIIKRLKGGAA